MITPDTDTLAGLLASAPKSGLICADYTTDDENPGWYICPGDAVGTLAKVRDDQDGLAQLFALSPELAAEVIALRAQADKDKARIERLEAALKGARALLRSGADLLSIESEALRASITVNGELRPDPEDAPAVEAIEEIEAWIADVGGFLNDRAALEDRE